MKLQNLDYRYNKYSWNNTWDSREDYGYAEVYKHYILVIKPALSNHHKEYRLEFALQYIAFDNEFLRKVIFSNKKKTFSTWD